MLCGRGTDGYDDDITDVVGQDCDYVNPNRVPYPGWDQLITLEDVTLTVEVATLLANDTDPDEDALSITKLEPASVGTVTREGDLITYSPRPEWSGSDSFVYTLSDGEASVRASVSVTVTKVDDPPVATDDTAWVFQGRSVTIPASTLTKNDSDIDSPTLTITAVGSAAHGSVQLVNGAATFTPDADFCGTAGFDYTVSGGSSTDVGHVAVTVACDPHITTGVDELTGTEDTLLSVPTSVLLANDVDADGDPITVATVFADYGDAWLEGNTVRFQPDPDYCNRVDGASHDPARLFYIVTDGIGDAVGRADLWIDCVNDPPITWFQFEYTGRNTPLVLGSADFEGFDIDWDVLTVSAVSNPLHGTVTVSDGTVTFVPETDYCGDDAGFDFTLSDGEYEATDHMYLDVWSQSCAGS